MLAAVPVQRGSALSPKVRIRTDRGDFLIKRRAPGRADPLRVAASHEVQVRLVQFGYPAPQLLGAHADGATALRHAGHVYEAMTFVPGDRYARTQPQARDAGRRLAEFHAIMEGFTPRFAPGKGRMHASSRVTSWLSRGERTSPERTARELRRLYTRAADRVEAAGFTTWPTRVIHGDYHPGNLLFSPEGVAAVVDFDAVRRGTGPEDLATAAAHFSIIGQDPATAAWPEQADLTLLGALLEGYRSTHAPAWLARGGAEALPHLMIESLISEAVLTLRIAEPDASPVTREMIFAKAAWLGRHAPAIATLATGA